jgi:hypothetical protein
VNYSKIEDVLSELPEWANYFEVVGDTGFIREKPPQSPWDQFDCLVIEGHKFNKKDYPNRIKIKKVK